MKLQAALPLPAVLMFVPGFFLSLVEMSFVLWLKTDLNKKLVLNPLDLLLVCSLYSLAFIPDSLCPEYLTTFWKGKKSPEGTY